MKNKYFLLFAVVTILGQSSSFAQDNPCITTKIVRELSVDVNPRVSHYMGTKAFIILKECKDGNKLESIRLVNYATNNLGLNVRFDEIPNLPNLLNGKIIVINGNGEDKHYPVSPTVYKIYPREIVVDLDDVDSLYTGRLSMVSWVVFKTSMEAVRSTGIVRVY